MISSKEIQHALYKEFRSRGWKYFSTNTYCFKYEADMLGITSSRFVTEFEIKRSRSDFYSELVNKKDKHFYLKEGKLIPNYFYFVCPKDLLRVEEIPSYCGLIYIEKNVYPPDRVRLKEIVMYRVDIVKQAEKLHNKKISDTNIILALRALMYKFFDGIEKSL